MRCIMGVEIETQDIGVPEVRLYLHFYPQLEFQLNLLQLLLEEHIQGHP